MSKFRMYVDEVGNSDQKSASNFNHRFLSLTGIILSLDEVKNQLHPEFEELKSRYFDSHPDEPIIFHRKEMMNWKFPFQILKNQDIRQRFDSELLRTISKSNFTIVTVVLDKMKQIELHGELKLDAYHYCMNLLLELYVLYLDKKQLHGDVMAEARGGKENSRLKKSFQELYRNGTTLVEPGKIAKRLTSREIKIKQKNYNIAGLQLADLTAHPSRNEILFENNIVSSNNREKPFVDRINAILKEKYDRLDGQIYGYGKNILPK